MAGCQWLFNLEGAPGPMYKRAPFAAGATNAVTGGDILELTGGVFLSLDADQAMAGTVGVMPQGPGIQSGDPAANYRIIVPRPGDVFGIALAASASPAVGADLYWSSASVLTTTAGTNVIGKVFDHAGIPKASGRLTQGELMSFGTTVGATTYVRFMFLEGVSWLNTIRGDDAT